MFFLTTDMLSLSNRCLAFPVLALLLFLSAEKLLDFFNKGIGQFWKIL